MNITNLWSVPIAECKIDIDIDRTLEYIKDQKFEEDPLGIIQYTVNKYIHKDSFLDDVITKVKKQSDIYASQILGYDINNPDYSIDIKTSWAARAKPGGHCNRHYHGMSLFTAILYLNVDPNKSNKVLFYNPNLVNSFVRLPITTWNEHNCVVYSFVPESCKMILFPSNIDHSTDVNTTEENLYSIVFDFNVKGVLGKGSHSELIFS